MAPNGAGLELADIHTPMLHEHWYVAGYADEFDQGLHERIYLDRSILIYRTEAGELVALQNRCAHRSFPLSQGTREGDDIRCRYHGALYNPRGEMVEFPAIAKCPRVTIQSYPIRIQGALAWIWMGAEQPVSAPPVTPWLDGGPEWSFVTGTSDLKGNWLLMAENLMDLTHIPFLHQASFNFPRAFAAAPVKLEIAGEQLSFHRDNPPNYQRSGFLPTTASAAIEKAGFNSRSAVHFISPALTYGGGRFVLDHPADDAQPTYEWQVIHFTTPIGQGQTRYWYFFARNYAVADAELSARIRAMIVAGFDEDRLAIELVQAMQDTDTHPYREVHFKSDAPSVAMRRIVAAMARRERAGARDASLRATASAA